MKSPSNPLSLSSPSPVLSYPILSYPIFTHTLSHLTLILHERREKRYPFIHSPASALSGSIPFYAVSFSHNQAQSPDNSLWTVLYSTGSYSTIRFSIEKSDFLFFHCHHHPYCMYVCIYDHVHINIKRYVEFYSIIHSIQEI
jgi:hypothetical protein